MKQIRIKDNSQNPKATFSEIPNLTKKIANKTLEQLEREGVFVFPDTIKNAEDIEKDQFILQSFNDTYRSGNVMGFLGYGNERLVIQSRFAKDGNDFFFQYLLERVVDFPNIVDLETDANQDSPLFNLLLFLFPYYLKKAMGKGIFKTYIRHEYNDCAVKGTIDIARHISKNTPFVGNMAYNIREFTYDNPLTELIRHTIEFIKTKPYGNRLLSKAKDEINILISATTGYKFHDRAKVIRQNKQNVVRHAYYREYHALQKLCIMILQEEKHQIYMGPNQIYGILFDGAWLWEEYVNTLIDHRFYHPKNKAGKGAQKLFAGGVGLIYPDFISQNSEERIIADAKYKPAENIVNRDYLQILAYMFRFGAKKSYFFYPEVKEETSQTLYLNKGSTYENNVTKREDVCVIKHGIKIPQDANNYSDFQIKIKTNEQELKEILP